MAEVPASGATVEKKDGAVRRSHSLTGSSTANSGLGRTSSKDEDRPRSSGDHEAIADDNEKESRLQPTISVIGNENGAEVGKDAAVLKEEASAEPGEEEQEYITGLKFGLVFLGIVLTCFLILLDTSIIVTAIPFITSHFHSLQDVGWYGSAYLISNAALQPLTGKVYSYFSSKWAFLAFLGVFELGSLLCAICTSSTMFIIGRAVAGLGTSGLFNGGLTILACCVPISKRPVYMGILMSCAQIGLVLGPLIGGALTQYTSWRWCFYINLPCGGLVAILLTLISIPDKRIVTTKPWWHTVLHKFDLVGFLLFAPAMVQLLLAVEWGGVNFAWGSATIIGLFCGAAGTFALFAYWEWRVKDKAMLPVSMMRQRVVYCSCLCIFFLFANLLTTTYYLPIYFQTVRNATPTLSGVYLLPTIIPMMFAAISSGALVARIGYYIPFVEVSAALAAIGSGLLSTLHVHTSTGKWIGFQIIGGFGRGLAMQMAIVAVQNHLPPSQTPTAMALIIFSQTLGGALFLSFDQTLFSSELKKGLKQYAPTVNAQTVIDAGAYAVQKSVKAADLPNVVKAYSQAIDRVFYLAVGCSIGYFIVGWGMGWKDIRAKEKRRDKGTVVPEA